MHNSKQRPFSITFAATFHANCMQIIHPSLLVQLYWCTNSAPPDPPLYSISQISAVNSRSYHTGTVIGLLPAQTINVYLGSKLRSIHEVLNDHHLGLAGYGVFVVEVSRLI